MLLIRQRGRLAGRTELLIIETSNRLAAAAWLQSSRSEQDLKSDLLILVNYRTDDSKSTISYDTLKPTGSSTDRPSVFLNIAAWEEEEEEEGTQPLYQINLKNKPEILQKAPPTAPRQPIRERESCTGESAGVCVCERESENMPTQHPPGDDVLSHTQADLCVYLNTHTHAGNLRVCDLQQGIMGPN